MKKILSIILVCSAFISLDAQNIRFTVFADPQFSWFSSDENQVSPNGMRFHLHTGIEMNYFFEENYAFLLGFGINNTGGSLLYRDTTYFDTSNEPIVVEPNTNLKQRLQYITIPLGLTFKTEELGYLTFSFQGGFIPMFNINANITSDNEELYKENIRQSTDLFNLNYFVGVNTAYRLGGKTTVIGGLKWSAGLTDVTGNDLAKITMNSISIHIGLLF